MTKITFAQAVEILSRAAAVEMEEEYLATIDVSEGSIDIDPMSKHIEDHSIEEKDVISIKVEYNAIVIEIFEDTLTITPLWRSSEEDLEDILTELENEAEFDAIDTEDHE